MSLVDEVVEAHGGLDRWRSTRAIRLRLSSGSLAFATKGQRRALHDLAATVASRRVAHPLADPGAPHRRAGPHPTTRLHRPGLRPRWARAAQDVGPYQRFDGFMVATRRRVHPRSWPHQPLLVWIDVHPADWVARNTGSEVERAATGWRRRGASGSARSRRPRSGPGRCRRRRRRPSSMRWRCGRKRKRAWWSSPGRTRYAHDDRARAYEATVRGSLAGGEVCEISAVGPVPLEVARRLAADSILRVLVTKGGQPMAVTPGVRTIPGAASR